MLKEERKDGNSIEDGSDGVFTVGFPAKYDESWQEKLKAHWKDSNSERQTINALSFGLPPLPYFPMSQFHSVAKTALSFGLPPLPYFPMSHFHFLPGFPAKYDDSDWAMVQRMHPALPEQPAALSSIAMPSGSKSASSSYFFTLPDSRESSPLLIDMSDEVLAETSLNML